MIQLTKPVVIAIVAGLVAIFSIGTAAWRLSTADSPDARIAAPSSPSPSGATPSSQPAPKPSASASTPLPSVEAAALGGAAGRAPGGIAPGLADSATAPAAERALATQQGGAQPAGGLTAGQAVGQAGGQTTGQAAGQASATAAKPAEQRQAAVSPAQGAAAVASAAAGAGPSAARPSFDVVRVDATGDAVVAGRAEPRAQVALMLAGKLVAQAQADADGQFVMLPPKLPPGDHVLALRATGASGEIVSEQTVAIAVPARGERETIAALTEPNKPTIVLSQPGGPGGAAGSDLRIVSVEAQQGGAFYASGVAPAGSNLRLYLNESYVASVEAGADGKWSIRIERGMTGGAYRVRADRIGTDGRASARVEAPFDYPAELARQTAAASQMNDGQRRGSPVASSEPAAASSPSVPESAAAASLAKPAATGGAAANQADASQSSAAGKASASPSAATPVAPGASPTPARLADPQNVVIQEVRTARVVRGDSLWKISHSIYGEGIRYTQIYDANTSQIRDPDLIYPGQVLVVPKQDEQKPRGNERRR